MIASPCKKCPKRNYPKEQCMAECQILNDIQVHQFMNNDSHIGTAIDYSAEYRYKLTTPFSSSNESSFF